MSEKQQETKRAELEKVFDLDAPDPQPDPSMGVGSSLVVKFSKKSVTELENFQRDESPDGARDTGSFQAQIENEFGDLASAEDIRAAARVVNEQEAVIREGQRFATELDREFAKRCPTFVRCEENQAAVEQYLRNTHPDLADITDEQLLTREGYDLTLAALVEAHEALSAAGQLVERAARRVPTSTGLSERMQAPRPTQGFDHAIEQEFIDRAKNAPTAAEAIRIANEGLAYLSNRRAPVSADGDSEF